MKYLITGAKGQLGKAFVDTLRARGEELLALGREELDVRDFSKVYETVREYRPKVVINCSAYNQVDFAERDFEEALYVNCVGVANLAIACREVGAKLVHYSTDYVFDGSQEVPYTEKDKPNPINRYGLSKYLGEMQVMNFLEDYLIFRTSWVYGEGKQNFLFKLREWLQTREYLRIAFDEYSVPTSTRTIVELTLFALKKGLTGLYHLVNQDYASRYEWAREYLRLKGIKKLVYPVSRKEFDLPAKRPGWSVMSPERLSSELGIEIKPWQIELKELIEEGKI